VENSAVNVGGEGRRVLLVFLVSFPEQYVEDSRENENR
jgi:hypothetical protein